jgi:HEAT repeat protein
MHTARAAAATLALVAALLPGPAAPAFPAGDPPKFEDAERLIGNPDWRDKLQGLGMLGSMKDDDRAEPLAAKSLAETDWAVVIAAANALGKIGTDRSRDALVRLSVEGEIAWIRDAAAAALRTADPKGASSRLVAVAKAMKEPVLQARAIAAIGRLGLPESMKPLSALVVHKETEVSSAAIRAVGEVGAASAAARDEAVKLLEAVLSVRTERKHFFSYAAAIDGLGRIVTPDTTRILVEELERVTDEDGYIPERIARGLAAPGRKDVAEAARKVLGKVKAPAVLRRFARLAARASIPALAPDLAALLENPDERVRSESARALGLVGAKESAEAIRRLLGDRGAFARREAVIALARLLPLEEFHRLAAAVAQDREVEVRVQFVTELFDRNDISSLPVLREFFDDRAWRVASAALAAYGAIGIAGDLPSLKEPSNHKDWKIRAAAFEAMGRLRAKEAIPLLLEGLRDRDPVVKGVCHVNLQILTKTRLPADATTWAGWWEKNGAAMEIVKRSRRTEQEVAREKKDDDRYGRAKGIEILQKARIVVVEGAWDKVQLVLGHLAIPHQLLRAQELKSSGLNPNQIILVNCEGNVDKDSAERLQWFVNVGGYLMSTDWALTKAVQFCFPGYAEQYSGSNTGNDVVVVEDALPGHPLTAGIFDNVPAMKWWLEIQAFPIRIAWPERCEVLVDSAEMKQRYGSSPMALTFRWGLGKVQHSLSHFYLQEEGMVHARGEKERMVFAADNLGLSIDVIRDIFKKGGFSGALNEATMKEMAPDYSMFRLIVNMVSEKSRWVEEL